jgi:hypothetical protein
VTRLSACDSHRPGDHPGLLDDAVQEVAERHQVICGQDNARSHYGFALRAAAELLRPSLNLLSAKVALSTRKRIDGTKKSYGAAAELVRCHEMKVARQNSGGDA